MENEIKIDIKKEVKYPLTFSSLALFLLGISTLILNLPNILLLDFRSIVSAINALFIIVGVVGIFKLKRWGLYFLGFSLVFPIILVPLQLTSQIIMLVSLINLIIFIDLLIIYKASSCKDIDKQKRLIRISKKYFSYISIVLLIILVTVFFNVLAAAFKGKDMVDAAKILGIIIGKKIP